MKKLLLVSLCFLMLCVTQVFAQNRTVSGTVVAKDDGLPVPGATVKVKGTTIGTQTTTTGKYTLSVPAGATLVVSFVSYKTQEVKVGASDVINVTLESSFTEIGEVVVTGALGVKRAAKELGYATTRVSGKEINQTNVTNFANGLTAKVAGLAVQTVDNSIDPRLRITLRGNRSLSGNNTALIVLDGVPIPGGSISSINPDDIAETQILKGAGAAAIYGSEASNGAIIITTKRGTGDGKPVITYGNSFQFKTVGFFPELQRNYGPYGGEGAPYVDPITGFSRYTEYENQLYGPAFDGSEVQVGYPAGGPNGPVLKVKYSALEQNPITSFFNRGIVEQNQVAFQQGDAKNSFYFSAQNVIDKGVVPKDKNTRTSVSVRGARTFGIFKVDYSASYTRTSISTYGVGYNGALLYTTVLQWPAFLDIKQFQNSTTGTFSNPSDFYDAYAINPYWITDNARSNRQKDVFLSNLKMTLSPTKWLDVQYNVSQNFGNYQQRNTAAQVAFSEYSVNDPFSAGSVQGSFLNTRLRPGQVFDVSVFGDGSGDGDGYARLQGDATANLHYTFFKDFKTSLLLGNTIYQRGISSISAGSNNLLIEGFYNINTISGFAGAGTGYAKIRQIAYFADLNIGYKDYLFLEGTLRNDNDSRLPKVNRSFWYPSGKISFVPTEAISFLKGSKVLNYAKVYLSLSRVGNISVGPYNIFNTVGVTGGFPYGSLGGLSLGTRNYSPNLKPEIISEIETGTELSFFDSRLNIKATYYKQNSKNQTLTINTSGSTGFNSSVINAGEIQSSGEEFEARGFIFQAPKGGFSWELGANFSINDSKVISLIPGINQLDLGSGITAVVGQPFPVYKGTDMNRDPNGNVIVSATTGLPSLNPTQVNFGRTTPKHILGITNTFGYKFVSLGATAEYRGGNIIYNSIGSTLNFAGSSLITTLAGRQRFVYPGSVINTGTAAAPVYTPNTNVTVADGNYGFWQSSAYNTTNQPRVSSAAFWKLREINLNFNLTQFVKNTRYIKGLNLSFTGRNLFLWKPKNNPWSDPEFSDTAGNAVGVTSANQVPGQRIYGADLKVTF
ncbi:SusC/RagA family TonB-linked outer membrane protein [Mucilaginibacter sp. ZT4R22]|uniref:SusC/RagA family TonB-linked outer membrane protein n=1 Tax=Mucilaginibacter pankratovii TaxID=2772110 RepID=A0ABR7WMW4_9SPHI|nr:SusC/RagA family TonB-linked outer membrane protein [Mucilaginibacter pankratovii]MBD1363642.1 SusC/RagA family TonB-linked outer membrane protein [Mucilaginibacter pankratovii]